MYFFNHKFFFINLPAALLVLLPFFLITGPFLPDLTISICSIIFLINSFLKFHTVEKYYKSKFFFLFLLFWTTLIISSLFSNYINYSLKTSIPYLRFGFFSLVVWFLLDQNKKILNYIFYCLIFCFIILIIDGYLQFFTKSNILGWKIFDTRVSSFFKDELILGSYISRFYPFFFSLLIFNNCFKNMRQIYIITIISLIGGLVFLSGERTSFFFLIFANLLLFITFSSSKKLFLFLIFFSILLISSISIYKPEFVERMFIKTFYQITIHKDFNKKKISSEVSIEQKKSKDLISIFSQEHSDHYASALKMFNDNKFFGIGTKLYRKNCSDSKYIVSFESCSTHPHNTYIQLLAETGIIGFLFVFCTFLLLSFFLIRHCFYKFFYKTYIFTDYQLCLFVSIFISLWPVIPTGNFFNNWLSVIYYLPVGFLLWSLSIPKKNVKKEILK
jgi:hypothetical protein